MEIEECKRAYELMTIGMIEKSPEKLRLAMSEDARLIHMTGKVETREEYIKDILDNTLNYYDYEIINFTQDEVVIRLLAKVYGGAKSWWPLKMKTIYKKENNVIKIQECRVGIANGIR